MPQSVKNEDLTPFFVLTGEDDQWETTRSSGLNRGKPPADC